MYIQNIGISLSHTNQINIMTQSQAQRIYDECNFYGHSMFKGIKYTSYSINLVAIEKGFELKYNCPA